MDPMITQPASREPNRADAQRPLPFPQKTLLRPIHCVGVVGLGHMGLAFARNLLSAGYSLVAYDRDPKPAAQLQAEGASVAARLADLSACDAVITSLPDDDALVAVALSPQGLADILPPGAIHISMSTVSPGLSRRLAEAHAARGQAFVAAPVLGNPDLARARQLFVLAGGLPDAIERARPVLETLGQRVFVMGDDPSAASLMKLAGNVLTATTLQCMGEVLALVRKAGIDPHLAFGVLTGTLFDGKVHKTYGGKIVEGRYSPAGMAAPLAVKDLRLALAEAERQAVPMPAASLTHDRLVGVVARGWGALDWSALGLLAASEAGMEDASGTAATTCRQA
jgi:3-hydroxyisobutyrate dehydrogenase-like beta-hydroxyacid dehydrogenase